MNEAVISGGLSIRVGSLVYQSQPNQFQADVSVARGPTPGMVEIDTDGTDIDLGQLDTPGLCRLMNLDASNYVEYGMWDPLTEVFYPLGELLPGETYILRFSRNLQEAYDGTGTGTTTATKRLRFKANSANCFVLIEAFEK